MKEQNRIILKTVFKDREYFTVRQEYIFDSGNIDAVQYQRMDFDKDCNVKQSSEGTTSYQEVNKYFADNGRSLLYELVSRGFDDNCIPILDSDWDMFFYWLIQRGG